MLRNAPNNAQFAAAAALAAAATAAILYVARRKRTMRKNFAPMSRAPPPATAAALAKDRWLALRHAAVEGAVAASTLEAAFDAIRAAFAPQQVDYSNTAYGKDHWKLSCFMEYSNGVAAGRIDLAKGAPMLAACAGILGECDAAFLRWYATLHPVPRGAERALTRLQSFVTRYRPNPDETHLPRHIDGANVDGSLVLSLPTYEAFEGGGLTVWDGDGEREVFEYPLAAGDAAMLDSRVWHQSNPITAGERWVIVVFYQVRDSGGAAAAKPAAAGARAKEVRGLLARRMVNAAKRKAMAEEEEAAVTPHDNAAAWSAAG